MSSIALDCYSGAVISSADTRVVEYRAEALLALPGDAFRKRELGILHLQVPGKFPLSRGKCHQNCCQGEDDEADQAGAVVIVGPALAKVRHRLFHSDLDHDDQRVVP